MQTENEKKTTDGLRLEHLRDNRRLTWSVIASELDVSTSMLHAVMRGEKRLGRDSLAKLDLLEKKELVRYSTGSVPPVHVRETSGDEDVDSLRKENKALKEELRQAQHTISNLSAALAAGLGRARALYPPTRSAASARSGGRKQTA